jgi:hypothetical protein
MLKVMTVPLSSPGGEGSFVSRFSVHVETPQIMSHDRFPLPLEKKGVS